MSPGSGLRLLHRRPRKCGPLVSYRAIDPSQTPLLRKQSGVGNRLGRPPWWVKLKVTSLRSPLFHHSFKLELLGFEILFLNRHADSVNPCCWELNLQKVKQWWNKVALWHQCTVTDDTHPPYPMPTLSQPKHTTKCHRCPRQTPTPPPTRHRDGISRPWLPASYV